MIFSKTSLTQTGLFHILLSFSAGALLAACGGEGDAETQTQTQTQAQAQAAENSAASAKSDFKVSNAQAKGLICKQSMGEFDRTTWIGNINYDGRSTMATRSTIQVKDGPTTLLHDNGTTVTSYSLQEGAKQSPRGLVSDAAAFDGDVKNYLSSMSFMYGQCNAWVVEPNFLSPNSTSSPSQASTPNRNEMGKDVVTKSDESDQEYLDTLVDSNVVRCGFKQTLKVKDPKNERFGTEPSSPIFL